jgi:tight adherence protein B
MMWIIYAAVFLCVAALIVGISMLFKTTDDTVEDRLDALAGLKPAAAMATNDQSLLAGPLDDMPGFFEAKLSSIGNIRLLIEQADIEMTPAKFGLVTLGLGVGGAALIMVAGLNILIAAAVGLVLALLPFGWLLFLRKRRFKLFGQQLPEALELMARGLRAGHSLQAGFQLVGQETSDPLGTEFTRVFEEQNLGVSLEQAMQGMTDRVPNLDLKFFATAIILQRQTGGDLGEILDKIGSLIRERFKIFGQIQALTGEGRLSGIVLLALAPVLFLVMLKLNYEYAMTLFNDPMGRKLMAFTIVVQLIGAYVIKKIVNIKV